jgi:hypothetical protein
VDKCLEFFRDGIREERGYVSFDIGRNIFLSTSSNVAGSLDTYHRPCCRKESPSFEKSIMYYDMYVVLPTNKPVTRISNPQDPKRQC